MPIKKIAPKRTVEGRLGALEQLAREHGRDIREVKAAVVTLERDVKNFREHNRQEFEEIRRQIEFLKTSDSLILKEMREGFGEIRGEMQKNFKTVFDHLDGISKQIETVSQEYLALKAQVQRLEERVARLEAERSH